MKILANQLTLPLREEVVAAILMNHKSTATKEKAEKIIDNTGFTHLRFCKKPSMNLFIDKACAELSVSMKETLKGIKAVIAVSQSFEYVNPNHSSRIQAHLDLPADIQYFDLVDGCNGFVKAITLLEGILQPSEKALIVTGELHSLITENIEVGIRALLGDGLGFTIIEKELEPLNSLVRSNGKMGYNITTQTYPPKATMNGVEVFNFTHLEVAKLIKQADWVDFDGSDQLFILHQANQFIVKNIGRQLKISNQTPALFNCHKVGNLSSASIPAWLANAALEDSSWHQGTKLHCVGYGSGLSWGIATLNSMITSNEIVYIDV